MQTPPPVFITYKKLSSATYGGLDLIFLFFCIFMPFEYKTEKASDGKQVTYPVCLVSAVIVADAYVNARHC